MPYFRLCWFLLLLLLNGTGLARGVGLARVGRDIWLAKGIKICMLLKKGEHILFAT